ncbi:MAG: hypothetical protein L3K19_03055 [Thermoplasmata archaeon]|nr:hypothetical protein [Thermoplasmata archaeon]
MATKFCTQCGGGNLPQASFCQYCGSALMAGPGAPLAGALSPSNNPPPPPPPGPWGGSSYPVGGSAPPKRRRWGLIVVGAVVALLVIGGIAFLFLPSSPDVVVTGINFSSPDNACGLNGLVDNGFNASSGDSIELTYDISGNNTTGNATAPCTIHSVSTSTPGFSVTGADVPLMVPANAMQLLSFSVNVPDSGYTGVLSLVVT